MTYQPALASVFRRAAAWNESMQTRIRRPGVYDTMFGRVVEGVLINDFRAAVGDLPATHRPHGRQLDERPISPRRQRYVELGNNSRRVNSTTLERCTTQL